MKIHSIEKRINRVILYLCLTGMIVFFMFPFYWIVITSLQKGNILYSVHTSFIPHNVTFSNYANVVLGAAVGEKIMVMRALRNSIMVALMATTISIMIGIFTAYAFARLKFRGSNIAFISIIVTEMLPPVALLVPFSIVFRTLHLNNTLYGLAIFHISWLLPITTWILYSYFKSIPRDLEDSARIDGATRVGAIFKIVLPLAFPGVASAAIICFILSMGEFMGAVSLITKASAQTLPLTLAQFLTRIYVDYGKITAASVVAIIFPVAFVLLFQRFIIKGLTAGAVRE